ncbi:MAG: KamA family radical SAM protein [Candidatus Omnitrophota bacterium]
MFVRTRISHYFRNLDRIPQLSLAERERLSKVAEKYVFRINDYYLDLIDWSNPDDPIRNLAIPREEELDDWGELDASNEAAYTKARGIQHKYKDTVLFLCAETCGAYCRYCFRKRLFMEANGEVSLNVEEGLQYIAENPCITNVLLTGGDPLILSTRRLAYILESLRKIRHVQIIRIGSKMPAFNPWRILDDDELLDLFERVSWMDKRLYLMMHFDHPRELTQPAVAAIDRVLKRGVICCNQCPIVKGINDDPEALGELFRLLSFAGCPPYYVFQGRPTQGNHSFLVPIVRGFHIYQDAVRRNSGLASRTRFVMSHETGKIEIVGVDEKYIYLKRHRSPDREEVGRILLFHRDDEAVWFDQLQPVE